jgi:hypothetical protein
VWLMGTGHRQPGRREGYKFMKPQNHCYPGLESSLKAPYSLSTEKSASDELGQPPSPVSLLEIQKEARHGDSPL